jgi:hypothetical protein
MAIYKYSASIIHTTIRLVEKKLFYNRTFSITGCMLGNPIKFISQKLDRIMIKK